MKAEYAMLSVILCLIALFLFMVFRLFWIGGSAVKNILF